MADDKAVMIVKLVVTLLLAGYVFLRFLMNRRSEGDAMRGFFMEYRMPALAIIAAGGVFAYIQLGEFHGEGQKIHHHEMYHLYLGAKYFDELGYFDLYDATVIAEFEDGHNLSGLPFVMNLRTYEFRPVAESLAREEQMKAAFAPERWAAFKSDLSWFRRTMFWQSYALMLHDHGFNSTPAWTAVAKPLANVVPVTLLWLPAAFDAALLLGAAAFIVWAFGWEIGLIGLTFAMVNPLSPYGYVGGSLLRHDWLFCSVGGLCCLYRKKYVAVGLLIGYATGMRLFPAVFLFGVGVKGLAILVGEKRVSRDYLKLAGGFAASLVVLFLLSLTLAGGSANWKRFFENMDTHNQNIAVNNVGMKKAMGLHDATVSAARFEVEYKGEYEPWNREMQRRIEGNRVIYFGIVAVFVGLLGVACWRQPDYVGYGLSTFLVFFLALPSNYYFAFLVIPVVALLAVRFTWQRTTSAALLLALFIVYFAVTLGGYFDFGKYVMLSVLLGLICFLCCLFGALEAQSEKPGTT